MTYIMHLWRTSEIIVAEILRSNPVIGSRIDTLLLCDYDFRKKKIVWLEELLMILQCYAGLGLGTVCKLLQSKAYLHGCSFFWKGVSPKPLKRFLSVGSSRIVRKINMQHASIYVLHFKNVSHMILMINEYPNSTTVSHHIRCRVKKTGL